MDKDLSCWNLPVQAVVDDAGDDDIQDDEPFRAADMFEGSGILTAVSWCPGTDAIAATNVRRKRHIAMLCFRRAKKALADVEPLRTAARDGRPMEAAKRVRDASNVLLPEQLCGFLTASEENGHALCIFPAVMRALADRASLLLDWGAVGQSCKIVQLMHNTADLYEHGEGLLDLN
jgi:hypothetical protein